jgi:serine/threonine protein kinase
MIPPDDADDAERTIVRPPSVRAGGAMAPTAAIAFPSPLEPTDPASPPRSASALLGHTLPLGTRLRDYEITGLIGEGGFGIVYLAWDHSLQRKVAVKEYMPASMASRVSGSSAIVVKSDRHLDTFKAGLKSFVNEARLLARFDHPSLVKVYRFWEENGTAYMVMPFYEGPTLKTALAELGHVPSEGELRAWLNPLLDALTVMHAAQCFHRDIAPDNILLTKRGPLLLDFGAARRVIGDMTHALTVVLKPGYAPIEQYGDVASMTQGAWTDLYALACVVYYAITGKTPMSSVERLMDDRLEPIAAVAAGRYSGAFLRAIDAALAVRPQDRPQNEARFRALLDADLPAPTPGPASAPTPLPLSHEPFTGIEPQHYKTVPGTVTPVLATQLLAPAPADSSRPQESEERGASGFVDASALSTLSGRAPDSFLPSSSGSLSPLDAAPRASRMPLVVVAGIIVSLGIGGAVLWALQERGRDSSTSASDAASAGVRPAVRAPAASALALTPPAPAPASAAIPMPAPSSVASPVTVERPAATAPPAASATSASVEAQPSVALPPATVAATPAPPPPARPHRNPATAHVDPSPTEPKVEAPRHASSARCSDILQKASLEPLTAEEADYLRRECR